MSNVSKKMLMAAAGAGGGAGLDIDECFSCHVYEGNGGTQAINNGLDLSSEGGLVWIKDRENSDTNHGLFDTERGVLLPLKSNTNGQSSTTFNTLTAFNSNGFSLGNRSDGDATNASNTDYVSWTFRKAKNFFDVVTYTGNGSNRTIAHNLGTTVGMMLVKLTSGSDGWAVYHRGIDSSAPEDYRLRLDGTNARIDNTDGSRWNRTAPTSSVFSLGTDGSVNANGSTYVAYLFAHNNNDGGFGPDSDKDIIKCGSAPASAATDIDLGFEPQWIMIKRTDSSGDWQIFDTMRGLVVNSSDNQKLEPNTSDAEEGSSSTYLYPKSNGFHINTNYFGGGPYIYVAIRRGSLNVPDDATKVFAIDTRGSTGDGNEPAFRSTFPVDFALQKIKNSATNWTAKTRLLGQKDLNPNTTGGEQGANNNQFDYMNGHFAKTNTDANEVGWMWKRAPGYFDVVCWSGDGTGSARIIPHNLTVEAEMIISKQRNSTSGWSVYVKDLWTSGSYLSMELNTNAAASSNGSIPNSSVHRYPLRTGDPNAGDNITNFCAQGLNSSGDTYVAYLFASVPNVSFVGSFVGDGNNGRVIDCGFGGSGARFILIKGATNTENFYVFDSVRGIVAGNDSRLQLDNTSAEFSNVDLVDPSSSGFIVNSGGEVNASGVTYIFYAIA